MTQAALQGQLEEAICTAWLKLRKEHSACLARPSDKALVWLFREGFVRGLRWAHCTKEGQEWLQAMESLDREA